MTAPPSPPAGWFPDPEQPGTERYWDGTQWTATTRKAGTQHHDQFTVGGAPPTATGGAAAPGYGPGAASTMAQSDVQLWTVGAHLSALVTSLIGFAFLGPLVIYLVKRDDDPAVRAHAAAALNFQLSWLIWGIGLGIITVILTLVLIGILLIPVLLLGAVAWFVFVVIAAVKASNGELYRYPLTIDFVS